MITVLSTKSFDGIDERNARFSRCDEMFDPGNKVCGLRCCGVELDTDTAKRRAFITVSVTDEFTSIKYCRVLNIFGYFFFCVAVTVQFSVCKTQSHLRFE